MPTRKLHGSALVAILALWCVPLVCAQMPETKPPVKARIRIGLSFEKMHTERWQTDANAFQARAEALGAEVLVEDAGGDNAVRARQVQKLLDRGIQTLVLVGGFTSEIELAAKAKNVHIIGYEVGFTPGVDLYVSNDDDMVGRLQASALTDRAPTGNYVILRGPALGSLYFHRGQLAALEPFLKDGRIKLVADLTAPDWSAAQAYLNMKQALDSAHGTITAVIATNDSIAGGAIEALEERGLAGKVLVSGQDADLVAIVRVLLGTQTVTIYKPILREAQAAAEAAVSLAKGEAVKSNGEASVGLKRVPTISLSPVVVTKDNVKETVIKDGFQTVREIKQALPKEKWGLIE